MYKCTRDMKSNKYLIVIYAHKMDEMVAVLIKTHIKMQSLDSIFSGTMHCASIFFVEVFKVHVCLCVFECTLVQHIRVWYGYAHLWRLTKCRTYGHKYPLYSCICANHNTQCTIIIFTSFFFLSSSFFFFKRNEKKRFIFPLKYFLHLCVWVS